MMEQVFGTPTSDIHGPIKRLRWVLSLNDQEKNPLPQRENIEKQLQSEKLPPLDQIISCCSRLNLNLDWLFFNRGQPFIIERKDTEFREMINFAYKRKEFRHSLLAKFYELKALYK